MLWKKVHKQKWRSRNRIRVTNEYLQNRVMICNVLGELLVCLQSFSDFFRIQGLDRIFRLHSWITTIMAFNVVDFCTISKRLSRGFSSTFLSNWVVIKCTRILFLSDGASIDFFTCFTPFLTPKCNYSLQFYDWEKSMKFAFSNNEEWHYWQSLIIEEENNNYNDNSATWIRFCATENGAEVDQLFSFCKHW